MRLINSDMKIFAFQGGLGNQLFEYAYYSYIKSKYPNHHIYGYYNSRALRSHNGLEIEKWFDVELPKSSFLSDCIGTWFFWVNKIFQRLKMPHPLSDTDSFPRDNAVYYQGYWQDEKYLTYWGG